MRMSMSISLSMSVTGNGWFPVWFFPKFECSMRQVLARACLCRTLRGSVWVRSGQKGLEGTGRTPGSAACIHIHTTTIQQTHPIAGIPPSPPTHISSPLCPWTIKRLEIRLLPASASSSPSFIFFIKRRYPRQEETPFRCLVKHLTTNNFGPVSPSALPSPTCRYRSAGTTHPLSSSLTHRTIN